VVKLETEIAKVEAELAKLGQLELPFKQFVAETSSWTRGRDPWSLMQPADVHRLDGAQRPERALFIAWTSPVRIADFRSSGGCGSGDRYSWRQRSIVR
jgi:hypothetical protein